MVTTWMVIEGDEHLILLVNGIGTSFDDCSKPCCITIIILTIVNHELVDKMDGEDTDGTLRWRSR